MPSPGALPVAPSWRGKAFVSKRWAGTGSFCDVWAPWDQRWSHDGILMTRKLTKVRQIKWAWRAERYLAFMFSDLKTFFPNNKNWSHKSRRRQGPPFLRVHLQKGNSTYSGGSWQISAWAQEFLPDHHSYFSAGPQGSGLVLIFTSWHSLASSSCMAHFYFVR